MKRGELAKVCGVNIETLRYYERRGLLPAPDRDISNHRIYDGQAVRCLRFIQRAKHLGFALAEIEDLLEFRSHAAADCADFRERAVRKIASVDRKIARLQSIRTTLAVLRDACPGTGAPSTCPILSALDSPDTDTRRDPPRAHPETTNLEASDE